VVVSGRFVKCDGTATDVMTDLPIRYPFEDSPRHVPAATEQWVEDFALDAGSLIE
jgi:hypothetical protein